MKIKTFSRSTFAALIFVSIVAGTANSATALDLINPTDPLNGQGVGLNVVDNYINNGHQASLIRGLNIPNYEFKGEKNCNDVKVCDLASFTDVQGNLLLPGCTLNDATDCLAGIDVYRSGEWQKAEYLGQAPGPVIAADEKLGIPNAGGLSLWKIASSGAKAQILLAAHFDLQMHWLRGSGKFKFDSFDLTVVPYELKSGTYRIPEPIERTDSNGLTRVSVYGFPGECAWASTTQCGKITEFEDGLKIRATLNIGSEIGGWLVGRVNNPEVRISQLPGSQSKVIVSGSIVPVPKVFVSVSKQDGLAAARKAFPGTIGDPSGVASMKANQPGVLHALNEFRELAQDSTVGDYSVWSLGSAQMNSACSSINTGFQGFVSTNASYYQATPPDYSAGFLNYTVAGYHYGSDKKTPNLGRYDLVMTSKFAKCLYGLKRIPRYATVRIASENGNTSASTVVLSEKNGWLKMAASGFTFSTKTIKIKLK